jgi:hypothetical protein
MLIVSMTSVVVPIVGMMSIVVITAAGSRSERDAAEHFSKARRLQRDEALAGRKACRRHVIGNRDQPVRIGALVAAPAHR